MENENKIVLNEDQKAMGLKSVKDLLFAANELYERLEDGKLASDMAGILPSLIEGHFCDISKILGYESLLTKEEEDRHVNIRKANERIRELEEQMGKSRSTDGLKEQLYQLYRVIYAWWVKEGFHHVSEMSYSEYGNVKIQFSFMINNHSSMFSDTPVTDKKNKVNKIELLKESGFELTRERPDSGSWELLDTPNNRELLKNLLEKRFPSVNICKYSSWTKGNKDNNTFVIQSLEVMIYELSDIVPKEWMEENIE